MAPAPRFSGLGIPFAVCACRKDTEDTPLTLPLMLSTELHDLASAGGFQGTSVLKEDQPPTLDCPVEPGCRGAGRVHP